MSDWKCFTDFCEFIISREEHHNQSIRIKIAHQIKSKYNILNKKNIDMNTLKMVIIKILNMLQMRKSIMQIYIYISF